ncbi:hypothetical protein [Flavivirga rizhaonensis]|uniref:SbsA Ig-like domain-containing protein n=1 Tax=Flavivirga rizhaonensis TaxID=2559571 RepID=A0A4S1DVZ5_9FLAO|nr:hypothetical protein [Flavivirga rizhaonensis]TGV02045.1 hypothetical protein EM932_12755 [Flavivirga rizhaonensis]
MKNIIYILSLLVISTCFLGCDENDLSPVIDESAKPSVSATSSVTSISESGSPTFTVTINFDKPIKTTTSFIATQIGGSASENDFSASSAVVPAYAKSATMDITINDDIFVEGSESVDLQISAPGISDSYEVIGTPTVSFNIENSVSNDFIFKMDWDAIYTDSDGDEHHLCDYDFDIEIYDAADDVVAASYSSCPEEIRLSPGDLPDGDYSLTPTFWSSTGAVPPAEPINIPAILTFAKPGVALETIDLTGTWDTETGGFQQSNPNASLFKYTLTISGSSYIVTDSDTGTIVFQG